MPRREIPELNDEPASEGKTFRRRPPTSADVARLAQVSQATVSLVLNDVGNSRFSDETRDRVLSAAEALGYVPHALASSLRSGQSNLVLITFLSLPTGPQLAVYYEQVAAALNQLGYTVLFHVDRALRGVEAARSWASLRPVGVIVDGERLTEDAVKLMRKAGVKAIVAIGGKDFKSVPVVKLGEDLVGRCAAEYLARTGRRNLAIVMPKDPELRHIGLARLRAFEEAAQKCGLGVQQVVDLDLDEEDAARVVAEWKHGPRPDGIFTFNDMYAGLLLSALQDIGLRVPDDIALVGCDDLRMGQFLRPRLTTIRFPIVPWARQMASLVDAIAHDRTSQRDESGKQEPNIVVRDSA
jgi:DNA-binding LacI/PurR family transcriptional regulator